MERKKRTHGESASFVLRREKEKRTPMACIS